MEDRVNKLPGMDFDRDEIIGLTEHHHDFYSRFLKNERDIIIWFPPSYLSSFKYYPVIYMHDGQNLFNPHTSFIGYDWKVDETATKLIKSGKMEEVIIVGIYNTKERLNEYNFFHPEGKAYANFIIRELKPFIDENYRTIQSKDNTAIIGSSMGGLISFQLAWSFPNVFGKCGAMSSSFWVDDRKIFEVVENDPEPKKDLKIYIDCGSAETELIDDTKKMIDLLHNFGYREGREMKSHIEEGAVHSEVDWAKRLNIPFTFLFEKNEIYF